MKRYKVELEIDSTEDEDKVQLFIMRSISRAISTSHYTRYNEDTLKVLVDGKEIKTKESVLMKYLVILGSIVSVFIVLYLYAYKKTQGLF